jgi:spore coat protein H
MKPSYWQSVSSGKLPRRRLLALLASAGISGAILACSGDDDRDEEPLGAATTGSSAPNTDTSATVVGATAEDSVARPEGWIETSHGNDAEPDYATVFPTDRVNQITLTVSPENWQAMLDNMTELSGARGVEQGAGQGGSFGGGERPQGGQPGAGGGPAGFTSENPIWAPATVTFSGRQWTNVGLRFKGNSSLRSAWNSGTDKMPFKLDFDEFEDDYPEIKNQRFYGFKQLSLSNNWNDGAAMREGLTYDLLDEAGLVAAETGFYEVLLDYGQGPNSLGLYTVIEVIDDTVIGRYFDDDSGNTYEAEGQAASFAEGTTGQIEASFQVESNEEQADWSDIRGLYDGCTQTSASKMRRRGAPWSRVCSRWSRSWNGWPLAPYCSTGTPTGA